MGRYGTHEANVPQATIEVQQFDHHCSWWSKYQVPFRATVGRNYAPRTAESMSIRLVFVWPVGRAVDYQL